MRCLVSVSLTVPTQQMNVCKKCDKAIEGGSDAVLALGDKYHAACFRCAVCNKSFARGFLTDPSGNPVHEECLPKEDEETVGRDCVSCRTVITGQAMLAAGKAWHQGCFKCAACEQPIKDEFDMANDRIYHSQCIPAGTLPDCGKCHKPCADKSFVIDSVFYHPQCVLCGSCSKPLTGSYFVQDGEYLHSECRCFTACGKCNKELSGSVVEVENQQMHKSCFACDYCSKPFDSTYIKTGDKYHHEHCK